MSLNKPVLSGDNYLPPIPTSEPFPNTSEDNVSGHSLSDLMVRVRSGLMGTGEWMRQHRNWLLILIPYLLAWWIPLTWCWTLWGSAESPMSFQPLVPLGVAFLLWSRRGELKLKWQELTFLFPVTNSRRKGDIRLTAGGCVLLLIAHLVHIDSVAVAGLILITFGIVRHIYGRVMMESLWAPLLFLPLMIPPPNSFAAQITSAMQYGTVSGVAFLVHGAHTTVPNAIAMPNLTLEVPSSCGGSAVLFPALALTAWLVTLLRCEVVYSFLLLGAATLLSLLVNTLRVLVMALLTSSFPDIIPVLSGLNPWLLASLVFLLTFLIGQATGFGRGLRLDKSDDDPASPSPDEAASTDDEGAV